MTVTAGALTPDSEISLARWGESLSRQPSWEACVVARRRGAPRGRGGRCGCSLAGIATEPLCFSRSSFGWSDRIGRRAQGFARHGRQPSNAREERRANDAASSAGSNPQPMTNDVEPVPLVSFRLPVRNGARTIDQAIDRSWRRRSMTGSSLSPTTCRATARRRSAPLSQLETSAFAMSRPSRDLSIHENFRAAFHHSRGTFFRWQGDDDWLEPSYAERTVAALEDPQAPSSARPFSSTTATDTPCR